MTLDALRKRYQHVLVGTVANDADPCGRWVLDDGERKTHGERLGGFAVLAEDGTRIEVELLGDAVLAPERTSEGAWREVSARAPRPVGDGLHGDGEVEVRGQWIAAGDRVVVCGVVTDRRFIAGTGGPRDAARDAPSRMSGEAVAVGGEDAVDDLERALDKERKRLEALKERREREIVKRLRGPIGERFDAHLERRGAWYLAALAVADVAVAIAALVRGLWPLGVVAAAFALIGAWVLGPTHWRPGGARKDDSPGLPMLVWSFGVGSLVVVVLGGIAAAVDTGKAYGLVGFFSLMTLAPPTVASWFALLRWKARARPGIAFLVPRSRLLHVACAIFCLASYVADLGWMLTHFEPNEDPSRQYRPPT